MSNVRVGAIRLVILLFGASPISGCAFLPGFSLFEEPALYYIPVAEVANQVACELQEFMKEHDGDSVFNNQRWVLADEDVNVNLNLQTDSSGSASFTGVNVAQLGFSSLQAFISNTTSGKTSVPSLGAKLSAKRTRTVKIGFTVSPNALDPDLKNGTGTQTINCKHWEETENPASRLYLKDWLNNYFETINAPEPNYKPKDSQDELLHSLRTIHPPEPVPTQFKIQSVELTTALQLVADVSAGATPNVLGNGTVFLLPVNGLNFDYSPDYTHTIDITLKICTNPDPKKNSCYPPKTSLPPLTTLLIRQCSIYADLLPLLSGVNPPKDAMLDGKVHVTCNKYGHYVPYQRSEKT
jgi:hypothetical protein